MVLTARKGVALLAACGLNASVAAYVGSYAGLTMDDLFRVAIVLHVGIVVLMLSTYRNNFGTLKGGPFSFKELSKRMPRWAISSIKLLAIFFAIHFLLFLIQSHAASPQIKNGEYVLDDHGRVLQIITQREYLRLKGAELRLFATGWMFFYFVLAAYWWFPRSQEAFSGNASTETSA